jgi:hypothetical protein
MVGARFEMVARMGTDDGDTVWFRTRMAAGKLVPLPSHVDPECFYVLSGQIEAFVVDWSQYSSRKWSKGCGPELFRPASRPDRRDHNRLARYFGEASRPAVAGPELSPPTPDDIQRLILGSFRLLGRYTR